MTLCIGSQVGNRTVELPLAQMSVICCCTRTPEILSTAHRGYIMVRLIADGFRDGSISDKLGTGTVCIRFVVINMSHWSGEEVLFRQSPLAFVELVIGQIILHNFIAGVKEHVAGCTGYCVLQVIH